MMSSIPPTGNSQPGRKLFTKSTTNSAFFISASIMCVIQRSTTYSPPREPRQPRQRIIFLILFPKQFFYGNISVTNTYIPCALIIVYQIHLVKSYPLFVLFMCKTSDKARVNNNNKKRMQGFKILNPYSLIKQQSLTFIHFRCMFQDRKIY